jgi:hypothetical protein
MHRSRAPSIAPGTFFVAQPRADCITNMPGFNLRQAHRGNGFVEAGGLRRPPGKQRREAERLWVEGQGKLPFVN